jgi:hypothetical protein
MHLHEQGVSSAHASWPARRAGQFNMMGARARMGMCVCVVVVCVWRQGFQNRECTDQPAAHSAARARDGGKTGPQRRPTSGRAAIPGLVNAGWSSAQARLRLRCSRAARVA